MGQRPREVEFRAKTYIGHGTDCYDGTRTASRKGRHLIIHRAGLLKLRLVDSLASWH